EVPAGPVAVALLLLLPVAAAVVSFGYLVAAWRPTLVVSVTAPVLLASYLLDLLVPLFGAPAFLRDVSIFHLYGTPLTSGPDWPATLALVLASIAFLIAGSIAFQRRDISR